MAGEFATVPLGDVAQVRSGYAFKSRDWVDAGVPVVKIANVKNGCIEMTGCSFVTPEVAEGASEFELKAGDILIAMTGYIGDTAWIRVDDLPAMVNQRVGRFDIVRPNRLDRRYLFYVLRSPEVRREVEGLGYGSAQPNVSPGLIHGVKVPLPDLDKQQAIAAILGSVDDKIELNRRMNRTLEAMARAIFKAWFIDFEPVKAKAQGAASFRGMPQAIFDELPTTLVESDLGPIPEGWEIRSTADIASYINGKAFTKHANGEGRMIIRIAELNSGPGASTKYSDIETEPDYTAFPDDLLFAWSGSLGVYRWHRDEAIINQHIFKVIPKDRPKWYVYQRLEQAMSFFRAIAATKATTMGHIKRGHLNDATFAEAPASLIDACDALIRLVFELVHSYECEAENLAAARDALLPRLLSGELEIPESANGG